MQQIKIGDRVKFIEPWYAPDYVTQEYGIVEDLFDDCAYVKFDREAFCWCCPPENLIKQEDEAKDNVNSPVHYNHNHKGIECIQAMEAMLTPEEFIGYLRGNIFKYDWRYPYKNGIEDLQKSLWYKNKLIEVLSQKDK